MDVDSMRSDERLRRLEAVTDATLSRLDASDLLDELLAARATAPRRTPRRDTPAPSGAAAEAAAAAAQDLHLRLKARESPQPRFCWHCRKPLHARSDRCPFCGETQ